ncbi:FAD-dependent oxidoreductase [Candidatus Izimaplasma bacterium ZiA1]|uniref:FAD-dependent oxidoreductase n=1 Tax=Candidatus Izimoplasma sp. ZiA1 TaxID=2024899 RepID=UPI001177C6B5
MIKNKVINILQNTSDISHYEIGVSVSKEKIVTLTGIVEEWKDVVNIGHLVANVKGVKNVVNDITSKDVNIKEVNNDIEIKATLDKGVKEECDVVIIGAGISGCSIARSLSKYNLNIIVLEKNGDIGEEATKANNGNIHPGFLAKPGTLKAKLNLRGNKLYTQLSKDLDFELKRPGSLVVFHNESDVKKFKVLKFLKKTGLGYFIKSFRQYMKTPGLKWLSAEEVKQKEPNLRGNPLGGFLMTTMGIVEPFEVCYALAENAIANGATFKLNTKVLDIRKTNGAVNEVITNNSVISCETVINCAGVYADEIAKMVDDKFYTIHPRRGAIAIIDKNRKGFLNTPSGVLGRSDRSHNSKGGGASVTPEGNLLWGPTAVETHDKEDKSVEASDLDYILNLGQGVTDQVKKNEIITFFSGIRAADYKEDFIIEASKKVRGFIHVAGIQSPGLAAAPAVGEMVEKIVLKQNRLITKKLNYISTRKRTPIFRDLSRELQDELIKENPNYGRVICRCELITEGEIIDAVNAPIPATSIDAVKRRSRAGMGRCQGGFCGPRVLEIIAKELNIPHTEVTLKGGDSYVLHKESRS